MYGLTRKDANNRTRLGVTSLALICFAIFLVIFYFSSKATKAPVVIMTDKKSTVAVAATQKSLSRWDKIQVDSPNGEISASKRRVLATTAKQATPKPDQAVLEMQGVSLSGLKTSDVMEYRPQLTDQPNGLEAMITQTKFGEQLPAGAKVERSDDGRSYLRTRGGVFTTTAEPGLKLVGPGNETYVVGDDTLLYAEAADGKRAKLTKQPTGLLHDLKFRYFRLDPKTSELQVATPGGPGAFRGPDGLNYAVSSKGTIQRSEGSKLVDTTLSGSGEFVGTDSQTYILANGVLFAKLGTDISFGEKAISGVGHFRDASGQLMLRGEDGHLYGYDEQQNTQRANLKGVGSFTGPDGTLYRRDEGSNVVRLVAMPVREQPVAGRKLAAPERAHGVSGTSMFSANPANYTAKPADLAADKAAAELRGGVVYSAPDEPAVVSKIDPEDVHKDFLPLGRHIPFTTLTKVSTQFEAPGMIEAVVAENVFFHDAVLPAGVHMYGMVRATGRNNRVDITFTTLVYPDGRELTVSGQVFDTSLNFGLEAYLKPLPAWVKVMRYAQVPVLSSLAKPAQPAGVAGSTNYNMGSTQASPAQDYAVNLIRQTQTEIEQENAAYLVLPMGTPGVMILTNRLKLKPAYGASAAGTPEMAPSLAGGRGPVATSAPSMESTVTGAIAAAASSATSSAKDAVKMLEPSATSAPSPANDGTAVNSLFGKPTTR